MAPTPPDLPNGWAITRTRDAEVVLLTPAGTLTLDPVEAARVAGALMGEATLAQLQSALDPPPSTPPPHSPPKAADPPPSTLPSPCSDR